MCAGFTEFQRTVETAPVIFPIVRRPFQHLEVVVGIGTAGLGPVAPALAVAVIITVVPVSRALLIGEAEAGIGDDPVPAFFPTGRDMPSSAFVIHRLLLEAEADRTVLWLQPRLVSHHVAHVQRPPPSQAEPARP